MSQLLTGKVAIITGASSGIGLATVKAFLAAGASVLGVDISQAPSLSDPAFHFHQANLTLADAPRDVVAACQKAFGPRIDALLNIAGIRDYNASVATLTDEDWEKIIAVNLTAPVKLTREVIKVMLEQKSGSIVNVASKAGTSGAAAGAAYTASKHGLVGITKNTAWLHKDDGIRCNAIAPGAVATNIGASGGNEDPIASARIMPVIGLHMNLQTGEGVADPSLAANLLVFLASDLSIGVNGVIVPTDNAWSVI